MKACPNAAIVKLLHGLGVNFDVSSGYEADRALLAGIPADRLSLSTQELPQNFHSLFSQGILFNACSLHQLDTFGTMFPGGACGIRFNPGKGSGGNDKTNVGGPSSSFGIWHELKQDVKHIATKHNLSIVRIHTHIGSGSDPAVWEAVSTMSLSLGTCRGLWCRRGSRRGCMCVCSNPSPTTTPCPTLPNLTATAATAPLPPQWKIFPTPLLST
jgi:diaminopimelate decarboxylase